MYPENVAIKSQEMSEQDVLTYTNLLPHINLIKFHFLRVIQLQKETVLKQLKFASIQLFTLCIEQLQHTYRIFG